MRVASVVQANLEIARNVGGMRIDESTSVPKTQSLGVGAAVEARFGGGDKWYKGTISEAHRDGTFDVLFNTGDSEEGVAGGLIRALAGDASSPSESSGMAGRLWLLTKGIEDWYGSIGAKEKSGAPFWGGSGAIVDRSCSARCVGESTVATNRPRPA